MEVLEQRVIAGAVVEHIVQESFVPQKGGGTISAWLVHKVGREEVHAGKSYSIAGYTVIFTRYRPFCQEMPVFAFILEAVAAAGVAAEVATPVVAAEVAAGVVVLFVFSPRSSFWTLKGELVQTEGGEVPTAAEQGGVEQEGETTVWDVMAKPDITETDVDVVVAGGMRDALHEEEGYQPALLLMRVMGGNMEHWAENKR